MKLHEDSKWMIFLMWVKESFVIRISGSSSNLRLAESQISGWLSGIAAKKSVRVILEHTSIPPFLPRMSRNVNAENLFERLPIPPLLSVFWF